MFRDSDARRTRGGTYSGAAAARSVRPAFYPSCMPAQWIDSRSQSATGFRSVLVPLDGSRFAEHALPYALQIAAKTGARVRLMHVHPHLELILEPDRVFYATDVDRYEKRQQQDYLINLQRRIRSVCPAAVTPLLVEADEVVDSLALAANAGTDLVVMASHGRSRLERAWRSSIADRLANQATVPLLLTHGYRYPVELTDARPLKHILIPLDGSQAAEQALKPAVKLAQVQDAKVTLLHVSPACMGAVSNDATLGWRGDKRLHCHGSTQGYLRLLSEQIQGQVEDVRTATLRSDQYSAAEIAAYCSSADVDAIAMVTHRRGRIAQLLRSSIVQQLLRRTRLPVLACPEDSRRPAA